MDSKKDYNYCTSAMLVNFLEKAHLSDDMEGFFFGAATSGFAYVT